MMVGGIYKKGECVPSLEGLFRSGHTVGYDSYYKGRDSCHHSNSHGSGIGGEVKSKGMVWSGPSSSPQAIANLSTLSSDKSLKRKSFRAGSSSPDFGRKIRTKRKAMQKISFSEEALW